VDTLAVVNAAQALPLDSERAAVTKNVAKHRMCREIEYESILRNLGIAVNGQADTGTSPENLSSKLTRAIIYFRRLAEKRKKSTRHGSRTSGGAQVASMLTVRR
jgi:hypothetical protein